MSALVPYIITHDHRKSLQFLWKYLFRTCWDAWHADIEQYLRILFSDIFVKIWMIETQDN